MKVLLTGILPHCLWTIAGRIARGGQCEDRREYGAVQGSQITDLTLVQYSGDYID